MVCNKLKKRKPVFIKRKWNHVVFSRATILSFHPVSFQVKSGSRSNGNEWIISHFLDLKNCSLTIRCCLISYPGHCLRFFGFRDSLFLTIHPYHPLLPSGLLACILCPHGADVSKLLLVRQHWHIHVYFGFIAYQPL